MKLSAINKFLLLLLACFGAGAQVSYASAPKMRSDSEKRQEIRARGDVGLLVSAFIEPALWDLKSKTNDQLQAAISGLEPAEQPEDETRELFDNLLDNVRKGHRLQAQILGRRQGHLLLPLEKLTWELKSYFEHPAAAQKTSPKAATRTLPTALATATAASAAAASAAAAFTGYTGAQRDFAVQRILSNINRIYEKIHDESITYRADQFQKANDMLREAYAVIGFNQNTDSNSRKAYSLFTNFIDKNREGQSFAAAKQIVVENTDDYPDLQIHDAELLTQNLVSYFERTAKEKAPTAATTASAASAAAAAPASSNLPDLAAAAAESSARAAAACAVPTRTTSVAASAAAGGVASPFSAGKNKTPYVAPTVPRATSLTGLEGLMQRMRISSAKSAAETAEQREQETAMGDAARTIQAQIASLRSGTTVPGDIQAAIEQFHNNVRYKRINAKLYNQLVSDIDASAAQHFSSESTPKEPRAASARVAKEEPRVAKARLSALMTGEANDIKTAIRELRARAPLGALESTIEKFRSEYNQVEGFNKLISEIDELAVPHIQ